jgi:hypothetical protein
VAAQQFQRLIEVGMAGFSRHWLSSPRGRLLGLHPQHVFNLAYGRRKPQFDRKFLQAIGGPGFS